MATMILSTAGNALFGPVGGFLGALAGRGFDATLGGLLTPSQRAPSRLSQLSVQTAADGAPMARIWGRSVVGGHVIWTGPFVEHTDTNRVGGKAGPKVETKRYSLSFAIGLCEGPITGIGRVWANGALLDMASVAHRVHLGSATQDPDPLVEAMLGPDNTPAWRDMAVLVFEDLPLDAFGERLPSLQVEVFAAVRTEPSGHQSLNQAARAVCLIPGSGEFSLATTPVKQTKAPGHEQGENLHASANRSDFEVALDHLQRDLPNVGSVSLVVAWFGDDLRCGHCTIRPKVETHGKQTAPLSWHVAGLDRDQASLVSQTDGRPAYGGAPTDASVIEAIRAIKARGLKVVMNPFVLMDIPMGNALPNPQGSTGQPAHPWRGRITCTTEATPSHATQVAGFFGNATANDFSVSGETVSYTGPAEWRYSRFVLHLAALAKLAGGVDGFLLGSELVGLTRISDGAGGSPAVTALCMLAAQVRQILGTSTKVGYGADWTEYGGQVPAAAPSDLWFPLDALWADSNIDFIGIDWYAPIADTGPTDPRPDFATLQAGVTRGEGYDWYYANDAARIARQRTPITDGAYDEPWVYRQKDLKNWWSNSHHPRTGGTRATTPTAWAPQSKPIWLMELGFPAVDRAANRPSVFPDPKSSESGLPPFSTGARDDDAQRLALEATLNLWTSAGPHNPVSSVYNAPMVDPERVHLWCWDARPYPWFPGLPDVWNDSVHAMQGHWLAGRSGLIPIARIIADICTDADVASDVSGVEGLVEGYVLQGPMRARDGLEPLTNGFGVSARSRSGGLQWQTMPAPNPNQTLELTELVVEANQPLCHRTNNDIDRPRGITLTALAATSAGQESASVAVQADGEGPVSAVDLPILLDRSSAHEMATRMATAAMALGETLSITLAPKDALVLESGDTIAINGLDHRAWTIQSMEGLLSSRATLAPAGPKGLAPLTANPITPPTVAPVSSTPFAVLLDLPEGIIAGRSAGIVVGLYAQPWRGAYSVSVGNSVVEIVTQSATMGVLSEGLIAAPVGISLTGSVPVVLWGGRMPSAGRAAIVVNDVVVDIIGWTGATLTGPQVWALSGVHRGLSGAQIGPGIAAGSQFVLLDRALTPIQVPVGSDGVQLSWTVGDGGEAPLLTFDRAIACSQHRPWSPVHVKAKRTAAGIALTWIRRGNQPDAGWGMVDVAPVGGTEQWHVTVLDNAGATKRSLIATGSGVVYASAWESEDFGASQTSLTLAIAQIAADGLPGGAWQGTLDVAPV